jgi:uncharacterized protein (DUF2062 family)
MIMPGIFGTIENPFRATIKGGLGVGAYEVGAPGAGLIIIISNLIKLSMVLAGVYTLINIILAGYGFLSAGGDSKLIQKSQERIWRSVLGLVIIVGSILIASVIGFVLYGSTGWNMLISPRIYTP